MKKIALIAAVLGLSGMAHGAVHSTMSTKGSTAGHEKSCPNNGSKLTSNPERKVSYYLGGEETSSKTSVRSYRGGKNIR